MSLTERESAIPAHRKNLPLDWQPPPMNELALGFRNGRDNILKHLPVYHLPNGLDTLPGRHLQPPRFLYGWPVDPNMLFDLATAKKFIRLQRYADGSTDTNERDGVHYLETERLLRRKVREDLRITSFTPSIGAAHSQLNSLFLTLWDNYKYGTMNPPIEDVEKIRQWLGFSGPAMWYLDSEEGEYWDIRRVKRQPSSLNFDHISVLKEIPPHSGLPRQERKAFSTMVAG